MTTPTKYCLLCGAATRMLHSKVEDYFFGSTGHWELHRCTAVDCGVAMPHPMPTDRVLAKAYSHYYTHGGDNSNNFDSFKAFLARLAYSTGHNTWYLKLPLFGRLLEEGRLSTGSITPQGDGMIIDIGSGSGDRLKLLQNVGWKIAAGVDPDPVAVETAVKLGRQVKLGSAEKLPWSDNSVDAAIMHHVIEHVRDPNVALREVLRVLKPEGYLALITPNIASETHLLRGRHWRGLEAPRHLTIFTLNALINIACKAGFEIECARSSARSGAWNNAESQRAQFSSTQPGLLGRWYQADKTFRRQNVAIEKGDQIGDELLVLAKRPASGN